MVQERDGLLKMVACGFRMIICMVATVGQYSIQMEAIGTHIRREVKESTLVHMQESVQIGSSL